MPLGSYNVTLRYPGDAVYEPFEKTLTGALVVYTVQSSVEASLDRGGRGDALTTTWMVGDPITLSWNAYDPLDDPSGPSVSPDSGSGCRSAAAR